MANEHSQIVPSMQPTSTVADFKFWCQKVLPLVYDDSLSYYEVLNKMMVYLNQVIDNINADTANVAELEDDFLLLQTYVNNFFDDIDQLVTYTERAEAAQTAAASSAISAATSASNAATSASNSAGSASSAATSALSALDAKDAAVAAKTAAETALANAQTAATNAAASATAASGSATNAAASATAAQNSFTLADAARSAAQSAASSAENDAENAADSAAEAVAAVDTIVNGLGAIAKTIENEPIAHVEDALASIPKKLAVDITPVQSGSGDPSPENVRPITGWTGANVVRTGKNLLDATQNESGGIDASGVETTGDIFRRGSNYITCKPNTDYTLSSNSNYTLRLYFYDINKNFIPPRYQNSAIPDVSVTSPNNASFIRWSIYNANQEITEEETLALNLQLELGSTASTYEPFSSTTIPITFPDAAGTVYGGTLTNENGDWKLRVTHKKVVLDNTNWTWNAGSYGAGYRYYTTQRVTDAKNVQSCLSSIFKKSSTDVSSKGIAIDTATATNQIDVRIDVSLGMFQTVQEWTDYLATTPVDVVYELATPVEYTLAESQALALVNGINNVWADTGNINTLEYFTNAENYVTSQIDLAKSLIAPVLKEMKADTALVANDFRIVGNTLYRITGNVASGGTLTPNTNCVATTIGEILKSLLSA